MASSSAIVRRVGKSAPRLVATVSRQSVTNHRVRRQPRLSAPGRADAGRLGPIVHLAGGEMLVFAAGQGPCNSTNSGDAVDTVKNLVDDVRADHATTLTGTSGIKDQPGVRDAPRVGQPTKDAPTVRRAVC